MNRKGFLLPCHVRVLCWVILGLSVALSITTVAATGPDSLLVQRARHLAEKFIIVDTHIDAPYRFLDSSTAVASRTKDGDFDYVRAREGGLDVPFMSIFTPASLEGTGRAKAKADTLIDAVYRLVSSHPDKFAIVASVDEVRREAGRGRILLAMGMENGSPVEGNLANLKYFFDRGVRYLTMAHAKSNHLADASYDKHRRWRGLSPFGRKAVHEMNRLGIMIDLSHLTDSAAFQVLRLTKAPVIASHSSCRFFTPGFERNISDTLIRAVSAHGGVVQINFGSSFLDNTFRRQEDRERHMINEHLASLHQKPETKEAKAYEAEYRRSHPLHFPNVTRVADHIDHVVKLVGVEHVGFGSDFDGVGDSLPIGLKDVSDYPNLIAALLQRGYSESDIQKICGGNLLRVWSKVEQVARQMGASQ
jgi:membrane dipeptidase